MEITIGTTLLEGLDLGGESEGVVYDRVVAVLRSWGHDVEIVNTPCGVVRGDDAAVTDAIVEALS